MTDRMLTAARPDRWNCTGVGISWSRIPGTSAKHEDLLQVLERTWRTSRDQADAEGVSCRAHPDVAIVDINSEEARRPRHDRSNA